MSSNLLRFEALPRKPRFEATLDGNIMDHAHRVVFSRDDVLFQASVIQIRIKDLFAGSDILPDGCQAAAVRLAVDLAELHTVFRFLIHFHPLAAKG